MAVEASQGSKGNKGTESKGSGGRWLPFLIAVLIVVVIAALATGGFGLMGAGDDDGARQAVQTVTPSDDNVAQAKSDVARLSQHVVTDLSNTEAVNELVGALPLADKAPQVSVDSASYTVSVTFSGFDEQAGAAASKDGSLDRDLLYDAVAFLACVEPAQKVELVIPGGDTYAFSRSEVQQSFGGPLNASSTLEEGAWAEILRKLDTPNFASSLVGLSTESGRATAAGSVG